jgi:drug/metabolite transporter (DMT)-like permease
MPRTDRLRLLAAFAAVYVVWGSTYLAIRIAIGTIPPLLQAGARFLVAGAILLGVARARGLAWPTRVEWRTAAIVGVLMLTGGNGGVSWSETRVPSGLAALIVGAVPLFTVAMDGLRPGGSAPGRATLLGLLIGFVGVGVLVNPAANDAARIDPAAAIVLLMACASWSAGGLYSRHAPGAAPMMSAGANMLAGGVGLVLLGTATGEPAGFDPAGVSAASLAALAYLIVFGSLIGFTAYLFLLHHTTPAKATTYAYVNPVVAILLGWALLDEPLTPRVLVAAAIIILAVVMITAGPAVRVWIRDRLGGGRERTAERGT